MKLVFMGPQGSGKGTQGKIVSKKMGIPHISTGDLLRNASGELKREIDSYINKGKLFPDEEMIRLLKSRIEKEDCKRGFILDGFPRNIVQAEMLVDEIGIDKVIELWIPENLSIERISNRVSCKNCGTPYNLKFNKPKNKGVCDFCKGELVRRDDDSPRFVKRRLNTYHKETAPILDKFDSVRVDGVDVEKTTEEILRILR